MLCPACRGRGRDCETCDGTRRVAVDTAVAWTIRHGSGAIDGPAVAQAKLESLLLDAIDHVLGKLSALASRGADADDLQQRASSLRAKVLDWSTSAPTEDERHETTNRVLGLHVGLSRLARSSGDAAPPARRKK